MIDVQFALGSVGDAVSVRLEGWAQEDVASRIWDRDTSIWSSEPAPELGDRLGWLDLPGAGEDLIPVLGAIARDLPPWITDLVLLGMGGSSLAPEVLAHTIPGEGLPLSVMDSTHPRAVRDLGWICPANTIFLVASKSGTTMETLSLFRHFWSRTREVTDHPGDHFIAITDPDTPLAKLGEERGFLAVIEAPPDVGGRFSALGPFGLVPAALMGVELGPMIASAVEIADVCRDPGADNPGLRLGAAIAELALAGRDKLTVVTSEPYGSVPDWIEQLVAESTGKDGKGIIPVVGEPELDPEAYGDDRAFVGIVAAEEALREAAQWGEEDESIERLAALEAAGHPVIRVEVDDPVDLLGLFFVWELAVAGAGAALGVHPFNQPDVQLAKELAREAMFRGPAGSGEAAGHDAPPDEAEREPLGDGSRRAEADAVVDLAWDVPEYGHVPAGGEPSVDVHALASEVERFLEATEPGDYVGIQAYLAGSDPDELEALAALREAVSAATGVATTLGYGPRFLHSTGQLHKGGPDSGVFIQIADDAPAHVHIPETETTFHELIRAQAEGDFRALEQRGRRVLRVRVGPTTDGIHRLIQLIERQG